MENADLPAMPNPADKVYEIIKGENPDYEKASAGLTKREMFAMHAMASWVNHHGAAGDYGFNENEAAKLAVECADALLEELAK